MLPSVATSTADSGFIAMIRTGVLALQLLPRNSSLKIGKTQFHLKISRLDGNHLKMITLSLVCVIDRIFNGPVIFYAIYNNPK